MPRPSAPPPRLPNRNYFDRIAPPLLIVAIGFAAYSNSFHGPFIYDDRMNIVENPHVRALWPLSHSLSAPDQSSLAGRPVLAFSFAISYALFGLDVRGYHAMNLAIHLVAGLVLFGLVRRTLLSSPLRDRIAGSATTLAAVTAALWVVHPIQSECVTYITQRAESLAGLWYLLTLYCVVRAEDATRRRAWHFAAVIACALSMATKEVAATAPISVLLYDAVFLSGSIRVALKRRAPLYACLAATWLLLAALMASGPRSTSVGFDMAGLTAWSYALTQSGVLLHYLRLAIWPHPLCFDYDWPVAQSFRDVWPFAVALVALIVATIVLYRKNRPLAFCVLWFFLILAPTSSVVPLKESAVEYRMYLSLAGFVGLVIIGGYSILRRQRAVRVVLALLLIAAASVGTYARNQVYRSDLSLWQDTVNKRPANAKARCALGAAFLDLGRHEKAWEQLEQARALDADDAKTHYNLGLVYAQLGRSTEAIAAYREAIRLRSNDFPPRYNLANLLMSLGRVSEAVGEYREAVRCSPDDYRGHFNLALALQKLGHTDGAVAEYRAVLRLKPDHEKAKRNLAAMNR